MSADTIVPNQANPQGLNRYSYVLNNPLRYTDPTGHRQCEDEQGACLSEKQVTKIYKEKQEKIKEKTKNKNKSESNPLKDDFIKNLNDLAIATQDLATTIDAGFAVIEVGLAAAGCAATSEAGCVEGAAGGLLLGQAMFNVFGGNAAETGLSFVSLLFTATADGLDDGEWGEATTTSLATFGAGGLMMDPIGDFVIDGYASGYNHGLFNGIETIFRGGSLFH